MAQRLTPAQIAQRARARGLDADSVLRVGSTEGLGGGIGDGGHAFGPFQLNDAGGVITGKFPGWTAQQKQDWAWSPQGVDYALGGIDKVAHGLHGVEAVKQIVNLFERPADPQGEIARAIGRSPLAAAADATGPAPAPSAPSPRGGVAAPLAQALKLLGFNAPGLGRAPAAPAPSPLAHAAAPAANAFAPNTAHDLALALVPRQLETRPGIELDKQILPAVAELAGRFGVQVNSGYRSAEHNAAVGGAENSDHLRGDAVDFTGPTSALQQLYRYAQGRFPYVEPWAQARDHVHISFRR
jgi:hypothetical protein